MEVRFLSGILNMTKPRIILASQSIGRKHLLEKLGLPFEILPSGIDEASISHPDPSTRLLKRARAKAEDVAKKLSKKIPASNQLPTTSFLIIAADSEAIFQGKTYGKARDKTHAREVLKELMGKTHEFVTGTSIIFTHNNETIQQWNHVTKALVGMRTLHENELDEYVNRYDFSRFAAAYTLNETPWDLITKIEGSYTGVIGLPFEIILPIFRSLNLLSS